ncbi:MAG: hypothetical protein HRT71_20990 [Flavobacteriales bacterium]|nr:hypothetical protein [Flavobacteriales bacterium]
MSDKFIITKLEEKLENYLEDSLQLEAYIIYLKNTIESMESMSSDNMSKARNFHYQFENAESGTVVNFGKVVLDFKEWLIEMKAERVKK